MVVFNCGRCGYTTTHKGTFKNHLKRKNICHPIIEDISRSDIAKLYNMTLGNNNAPKMHPNALLCTQIAPSSNSEMHPNCTQNAPKMHPNAPKMHPKTRICEFCNKEFTRTTGLKKHLEKCKERAKKNNMLLEKDKELEMLKDKVEDLMIELSKKGNITNNNTTHNHNDNIINIHINNYGNENTDYLNQSYLNKLLKGMYTAIPKLIEKIHFDPKHPENHNIKITNKKEPYIKIRIDDKWQLQDKKETLETLVDEKYYILECHYSKVEDTLQESDNTKKLVGIFKEKFAEDDEFHREIEKKSELIILNNSLRDS